jgi:hypothetical protein
MSGTTDEIKGRVKEAIGVVLWSRRIFEPTQGCERFAL